VVKRLSATHHDAFGEPSAETLGAAAVFGVAVEHDVPGRAARVAVAELAERARKRGVGCIFFVGRSSQEPANMQCAVSQIRATGNATQKSYVLSRTRHGKT